jgi:cob(I)alamin adenosyltransferase
VALKQETDINPIALQYLNRLSDWLFMVARAANAHAGVEDVTWQNDA